MHVCSGTQYVRVAQEGVKVPVMVHVSVHRMVISEWSKCNLRAGI